MADMKVFYTAIQQVLVVVCLLVYQSDAGTEYFSSLGQMEDLIHDEVDLLSSLEKHIETETIRLARLKEVATEFQRISDHANSNIESYLSHPVDQYRLVKRLAVEWQEVEDLVRNASDFVTELHKKQENFPTNDDVVGTAEALMRLQDTYKLDTHLLASGEVKGRKANESLTAEDCYQIGRTAYLNEDYYHCKLWMKEVLLRNKKSYVSFDSFDVLDHLAFCTARLGDILGASDLTVQILQIDPDNERIQNNYRYYQSLLATHKKGDEEINHHRPKNDPNAGSFERSEYEQLCRGEGTEVPLALQKKLKCYYWTNRGNPRLILKPLKMEELFPSPHLVFFHEFLSDDEMVEIKRIAKPKLNRATVQNPFTGKLEHAKYRVSKSTWLEEDEGDQITVANVNQRISDATGLSMSTAEMLQIANYGVGGQYEPHYDCARKEDAGQFEERIGNRIATLLIYMTDVADGGYTVFLPPKIAVKPEKGGAAFWHNLYPSGDVDLRTRHAACPVLTGIKWVSNKWIHERDNEFNRICGLERTDDNRFF